MTRMMKMIMTVEEEKVGGFIAELSGRVNSIAFETVEIVDRRSKPVGLRSGGYRERSPRGTVKEQILSYLSQPDIIEIGATSQRIKAAVDGLPQSVNAALNQLKSKQQVRKDGAGHWFIVKAKEAGICDES